MRLSDWRAEFQQRGRPTKMRGGKVPDRYVDKKCEDKGNDRQDEQ